MNKVFAIDKDEQLKRLVASAEPGEQLELTVDGQVVAKVVPQGLALDSVQANATLERIAERAKHMKLGGVSIKQLIDEGRKY
jgi:antitoxin (DNA-binding transcriptional repressor) of toxin-antitoxin stability system